MCSHWFPVCLALNNFCLGQQKNVEFHFVYQLWQQESVRSDILNDTYISFFPDTILTPDNFIFYECL